MVTQAAGEAPVIREGRVIRLLADLDPMGRMARVLVAIDDPLALDRDDAGLPLLLGAYVSVELGGKEAGDAVRIPRAALRERNRIYLYDDEKLKIVEDAKVLWSDPESVYVRGIDKGALAITSPIKSPFDGMELTLAGGEKETEESEPESGENG